ncbi:MAG: YihY/virulence factor BrkB family protein [Phycisphaeraceae bacterium]|nr:YihY/virulence factor BrkB family protein [Phycisphaeraceae bacterium]
MSAEPPHPTRPPAPPATDDGPPIAQERSAGLLARAAFTVRAVIGDAPIAQMSAALAYRTIFSLVPLLLLSFLLMRLFRDTDSLVERSLYGFLELTGLSQIAVGDAGTENIQSWIAKLVAGFSGLNFTGIGLVSAATLIYAGVSLLNQMELAFNGVYGVQRGRSLVRRFTQNWLIITAGPMLLVASFAAADQFRSLAASLADGHSGAGPWLVRLSGFAVTVAISTALLGTLYVTLPNTRVRFVAAITGALAAAVGMEGAKAGFGLYLRGGALQNLYGSLALVPLFLLWVYVTWFVVLTGLRLAYVVQHGHVRALRRAWSDSARCPVAGAPMDPGAVIAVMALIVWKFSRGGAAEPGWLIQQTDLDPATVRRALGRLTAAGLVNRLAESAGTRRSEAYAPARPPERIDAGEVVAAAVGFAPMGHGPGPLAAVDQVSARLRAAQVVALRGLSMAHIAAGHGNPVALAGEAKIVANPGPTLTDAASSGVPGPAKLA